MTDSTLTCYIHPNRPTLLRCNHCERPICASCATRTPTGYRCKECVRGQQKIFDTAQWSDYVIVFFTAAFGSAIGSALTLAITSFIWGFFVIGLAPLAGVTIANIARRFVKGRRSRWLNLLFAAGMIVGALPMLLTLGFGGALTMIFYGGAGENILSSLFALGPLLWQVVYLVMAAPAAYSQFSGLFFRR